MKMLRLTHQLLGPARISLLLAGILLSVVAPLVPRAALAADTVTLSGRAYNADTGSGYAGVTVTLCGAGSAVTTSSGNWQLTVAAGTPYCARIAGGGPVGINGPITRNNPEAGVSTTYENQVAGTNCYHNTGCAADQQVWDRVVDGGLDFVYTVQPVPPVSTPAPTPATATPAASPAVFGGAPTNFKATVPDGSHQVDLAWQPAGDPAAIKAYKLERSVDNVTWETLSDTLTEASYRDQTAAPGVHYYYRLSAVSQSGAVSEYALADASTGDVLAADTSHDRVFDASDKLAQVSVPAGAVPDDAGCTVEDSSRDVNPGADRALIVGPYALICKSTDGSRITDFKSPVTWKFKLAAKIAGYHSPQAASKSTSGELQMLSGGVYDAKAQTLTVKAPGDKQVLVLASATNYAWVNYAVLGGLILVVGLIVAFLPFRARKKVNYQEYLRAKYYNL